MNLHEYQAKELLQSFHIPIPLGVCLEENNASTLQQALQVFKNHTKVAVKAQIHAGGRAKGCLKENGLPGVQLVPLAQVPEAVASMFQKTLVTKQTGSEGKRVHKVYLMECVGVQQEFYCSILLDRTQQMPVLVASSQGGCDIEEHPEHVLTIPIDPLLGLQAFQARRIAELFQLNGTAFSECVTFLLHLYHAFVALDTSMIEINPLVLTKDQHLLPLDAKIQLDDNARFRHPEWEKLEDAHEKDPQELEAASLQLHNYIALDGNIACLSNGAGLCMATIDLLHHLGGKIANFLDIGDSASEEQIEAALNLIFKNPRTMGVFINLFGGTLACDQVAKKILEILPRVSRRIPIIVRFKGNRAQEGKKVLEQKKHHLPIFVMDNSEQAIQTILQKI